MSLTTCCLCPMMPGKTLIMLCQDSKHILHHPSAFGDPVVCSFLFIGELSSAAEFHKFFMASMQRHRHLARNSVNLVHSPHGFRWQKHQDALLDLFPQLAEVKYFMYRTKIHLTRHLPRGCCILYRPGLAAPEKVSPY